MTVFMPERNPGPGKHCTAEEARRFFEIEAAEKSTKLDYRRQLVEHRLNELHQEEAGEGTRPVPVLWANAVGGFGYLAVSAVMVFVHYAMIEWAMGWLQAEKMVRFVALALPVTGAASIGLFLHQVVRIFVQRRHDVPTVCLAFLSAAVFLGSVYCSSMLGSIRADLIAKEIQDTTSGPVIEGEAGDERENGIGISEALSRFFERTVPILGLLFPLMSVTLYSAEIN